MHAEAARPTSTGAHMTSRQRWFLSFLTLLAAALLTACGGGGNAADTSVTSLAPPATLAQLPGAPVATGDTATDGFNWFIYRRAMAGLPMLSRNALLNTAAQGHANYLRVNDTVSHDQTPGAPGFTGAQLLDRLAAAGYTLVKPYAYGEVISATSDTSGFYQAEQLVAAIYHRFVIFEPVFKEAAPARPRPAAATPISPATSAPTTAMAPASAAAR